MVPPIALVALAAVLVLAVLYLVFGSKRAPPAVLLLGPCGGGKTVLFHRLTEGETVESVSSMMANEAPMALPGGGRRVLVDFPGHHRLRGALAKEIKRAVGVVFCFDASAASAQAKPAGEVLFALLTSGSAAPLLVLCNKSDAGAVKSPARVKLMLANELETLRKTARANATLGDDAAPAQTLGVEGKFFSFEENSPCPTTFLPFSGKTGDLAPVADFVAGCK